MSDFKGRHFAGEIVLWAVRWYCRYGVSYRDLEQMMGERGVSLDHSTIYRWVRSYAPEIEKRLRWQWRRPYSTSWRIDETYVKVRGYWTYLYRALDKHGNTIDFYLSPTRNTAAAKRFLGKALHGLKDWEKPRVINTDQAPIDVLSLASLEGPRSDTLYLATAGGLGPTTIAALRALLAKRADLPAAQLVAATDADDAGEHYAAFLAGLAREAGVTCERLRPPRALVDWNAILVRAGGLVAHASVHA